MVRYPIKQARNTFAILSLQVWKYRCWASKPEGLCRADLGWIISGTDMTGRQGDRMMDMNGESPASYLARTPRVPLVMLNLITLESNASFILPKATWDHFHCPVEPSPGHIRCRFFILATRSQVWPFALKLVGSRVLGRDLFNRFQVLSDRKVLFKHKNRC